jgi:hypothetical protein
MIFMGEENLKVCYGSTMMWIIYPKSVIRCSQAPPRLPPLMCDSSSEIRPRPSATPPDFNHLLDKVIARDVILRCMRHYGILDRSDGHLKSSSDPKVATRTPVHFSDVQVNATSLGHMQPKVEKVPQLATLLGEGYRLVQFMDPR